MSFARRLRRLVVFAVLGAAALGLAAPPTGALPPIHHVFMIVLENESASTTFGPGSPAPYLSQTLRGQGAYLPNYYGIGHASLDNYIAMISGQAPNLDTQSDCQQFVNVSPGTIGSDGQALGIGCVYPAGVQTIASQLSAAGLTWRDYNDGMGADPSRESVVCAHPGLGSSDNTQSASATDQYATRHNPFVYFHSIIDDTTLCDTHVVNLDLLPRDLASASHTPNFTFITPNLCDDGHDATCANGGPGGLGQADAFLRQWVPQITSSPAFREQDGLLIIAFDEAASSDVSSCCGEIPGPGSPLPGVAGAGGGDTGAVLLSPCIAPATTSAVPYNHYTMLRSVEDVFGLPHLGYAGLASETSFGSDIFNVPCTPSPPVARVSSPAIASSASARPRIRVSWSASDKTGADGMMFNVEARRTSSGSHPWVTLLSATARRSLRFAAALGQSYRFRVQAINGALQSSPWASASTVVPTGTRVPGGRYHGSWRLRRVRNAWEGRARVASSASASFTLRYVGGALSIIGERWPRGGRASIVFDGRAHRVSLHARRRHPRVVIFKAGAGGGHHRLKINVLRGTVSIEGIAIASRAR